MYVRYFVASSHSGYSLLWAAKIFKYIIYIIYIIYINKLMVKWGPAKIKNTAVELYFASGIFLKYLINATLYIHV